MKLFSVFIKFSLVLWATSHQYGLAEQPRNPDDILSHENISIDRDILSNSSLFEDIIQRKASEDELKKNNGNERQENQIACTQNELSTFERNVTETAGGWEKNKKAKIMYAMKAGNLVFALLFRLRNNSSALRKSCSIAKAYRTSLSKLVKVYRRYHEIAYYGKKTLKNQVVLHTNFSYLKRMICGSEVFRNPTFAHKIKPYRRLVEKFVLITTKTYSLEQGANRLKNWRVRSFLACKKFQPENFKLVVMSQLRVKITRYGEN